MCWLSQLSPCPTEAYGGGWEGVPQGGIRVHCSDELLPSLKKDAFAWIIHEPRLLQMRGIGP